MSQQRLLEMFNEVVLKKDASLIQSYFHPGFILESDGRREPLAAFLRRLELDFATSVDYQIQVDERAWVTSPGAVGARFWLTCRRPGRLPLVTQHIVLANFMQGRIHRMWALSWPGRPRRAEGTSRRKPVPSKVAGPAPETAAASARARSPRPAA